MEPEDQITERSTLTAPDQIVRYFLDTPPAED